MEAYICRKKFFRKASDHIEVNAATRIKALRILNGYTQAELAEYLGISQSNLSSIELGQQRVMSKHQHSFAEALKVSPKILFTGKIRRRRG